MDFLYSHPLCACVLSCFSCVCLVMTLWTVAHQTSPHALLQGIFWTQGLNPGLLRLLYWRQVLYR